MLLCYIPSSIWKRTALQLQCALHKSQATTVFLVSALSPSIPLSLPLSLPHSLPLSAPFQPANECRKSTANLRKTKVLYTVRKTKSFLDPKDMYYNVCVCVCVSVSVSVCILLDILLDILLIWCTQTFMPYLVNLRHKCSLRHLLHLVVNLRHICSLN